MKDHTKKAAMAELEVLKLASTGGAPSALINGVTEEEYASLLNEASLKQVFSTSHTQAPN